MNTFPHMWRKELWQGLGETWWCMIALLSHSGQFFFKWANRIFFHSCLVISFSFSSGSHVSVSDCESPKIGLVSQLPPVWDTLKLLLSMRKMHLHWNPRVSDSLLLTCYTAVSSSMFITIIHPTRSKTWLCSTELNQTVIYIWLHSWTRFFLFASRVYHAPRQNPFNSGCFSIMRRIHKFWFFFC